MSTSSRAADERLPAVGTPSAALVEGLDAFEDLVSHNEHFLVVSHKSPDGDAVGSTLATALLLEQRRKQVTVYNRDPIPYNFQFLPGTDRWRTELNGIEPVDATVVLDCGEPSRVGENFPAHGWGDSVAVIDHHDTWDDEFADVYVRDPDAAATGELLYRVARRFEYLSTDIARNLYCCLMTDTGGFRYSNTSKTAFRVAGELLERGVDSWEMSSEIYENQPRERLELLSRVLQTLSVSSGGRLAFLRVERRMLEELGIERDLTDGFINYARSIRGVEVATQLRERTDGSWRISFRSRGRVDVSALAEEYGGGGHHNAAGCVIDDAPEAIERKLTQTLVDLLEE